MRRGLTAPPIYLVAWLEGFLMSSPIDLTTLANVKAWLSGNGVAPQNPSDDLQLEACITAWSAMFLQRTGRGPQDGSEPTSSPFVAPVNYTEVYDGNGHDKLYLRNSPIQSVSSLIIGQTTIPASTGFGVAGYGIGANKKFIFMRQGGSATFGYGCGRDFWKGIQNIQAVYEAGYTSTPDDVAKACIKASALEYKRKDWIGLRSKAMAQGAGTVSYVDFEYDPDVERLIANYTRWTL